MSDIVIEVEHLSKKYTIRHQIGRRDGLSHAIHGMATAPFRWLFEQRVKHNGNGNGNGNGSTRLTSHSKAEEFHALKDVSFQVKCGEVVGIIGRNGAGKSTLLKILSRITEPTNGRVRIKGRVASLLEVGTGFHPELTGRENIFLNGAILGMTRQEIKQKFDEIVAFAEVDNFIDTPVKRYSSGMYVRLAFAVAAHLEPEILLVDEVLAVGDAAFQKKCLGKMEHVAKGGRSVIFVSHNLAAIETLCTVAHCISRGELLASGNVSCVVEQYLKTLCELEWPKLAERTDREGDGRVMLTDVSVVGYGNQPTVACGSAVRFEICYRSVGHPRNVQIALGFYNSFGEGVLHVSNDVAGEVFNEVPDEGTFLCSFDRLPLVPGTYVVNVCCVVNGSVADWVKDAARIQVESGDFYGTGKLPPNGYGSVVVPHYWALMKSDGRHTNAAKIPSHLP